MVECASRTRLNLRLVGVTGMIRGEMRAIMMCSESEESVGGGGEHTAEMNTQADPGISSCQCA